MSSTYARFDTVFLLSRFAGAKYSPLWPSSSSSSHSSLLSSGIHLRAKPNSRLRSVTGASSSSSGPIIAGSESIEIKSLPTKPIEGQKTGTSGLRKKVKVFMQDNYLANWIQTIDDDESPNLSDRYINFQFNYSSGQPAPESITDKIYGNTLSISEIKVAEIPDIDLSHVGVTKYGNFSVEVIDPISDYLELMEDVFDFDLIRGLLSRSDFGFMFDAMHAVTGAYAKPIFVDNLEAKPDSISNGVPLEDFGHGHPDPNLTYAKDLVDVMYRDDGPDFGAASDAMLKKMVRLMTMKTL
ncbi:hypothetical protein F2Q69_00043325 [Brassica cretica]|uniref:Alpha-D-phosphohexomutase alpha/beta/alpha domain-containing protein n=1 Tax=Brassica cretica TaxID=69181 RepID=A0A8S9NM84_BRACR|nr:hypothetical protein F2Q69_00043325 [Brassica cretica]